MESEFRRKAIHFSNGRRSLYHSIAEMIAFPAYTLVNAVVFEQHQILFVPVFPALIEKQNGNIPRKLRGQSLKNYIGCHRKNKAIPGLTGNGQIE